MRIAGLDIGGANTDLALVELYKNGEFEIIRTDFQYLPMWMEKESLGIVIKELLGEDFKDIDAIAVSMTAELVDAYTTKSEGVLDIANKIMEVSEVPVGFVGTHGIMNYSQLIKNPLQVAAANWVATVPLASMLAPEGIMIDTGSTTTDIIPFLETGECARGRTDLERLATGELVYSGMLRTNVAVLTDKIPLKGEEYRLSSELFAIMADVHLTLGNISEDDYSCSTTDGASKSYKNCLQRLARVICADLDLLETQDVEEIAKYLYQCQIDQIVEALQEVAQHHNLHQVVATGLGMDHIGKKVAKKLGLKVKGMDEIFTPEQCTVAPAIGTALLMESFNR